MRIKRKYVTLTVLAALCLGLLWKISFVEVPLLLVAAEASPWRNVNEQLLGEIAAGRQTLIVLKNWRRAVRKLGLAAGDLIIAEDLTELRRFLRDRPDALAVIPWYDARPGWRTLRLNGLYFWENQRPYPLVSRCFSWGWLPKYKPRRVKNITIGGQVLLARGVGQVIDRTSDANYPWQGVAGVLRAADLAVVTLQAPLVYDYVKPRSPELLYGKARYADGLSYAGIDLVALSGRSMGDAGVSGIRDTLDILGKLNIPHIGLAASPDAAYAPCLFKLNGLRVAFLARRWSGPSKYTETDLRGVARTYYLPEHSPSDSPGEQAPAADLLILLNNDGADSSVNFWEGGNLADGERSKAAPQLGSLIFDQPSGKTGGALQRIFVYGKKVAAVDVLPVFLNDRWYTEIK
ncbi:MAG: CapA family protein [Candidatus Margulisbacteria bacterium]|nr:CapA family protein [Candidatus Margulisiibacteriota bacterium]